MSSWDQMAWLHSWHPDFVGICEEVYRHPLPKRVINPPGLIKLPYMVRFSPQMARRLHMWEHKDEIVFNGGRRAGWVKLWGLPLETLQVLVMEEPLE